MGRLHFGVSVLCALALASACSESSDSVSPSAGTPTKDAAGQGKEDGADVCKLYGFPPDCDLCKESGWYGDGECDENLIDARVCVGPDPDCSETCWGEFLWLQKDAYKETAGRTTAAWPPHTTTVLEIHCSSGAGEAVVASSFRENHGTKPGTKDAKGDEILVEVKRGTSPKASRKRLLALQKAFDACECSPATKFLSLDALNDELMGKVLQSLQGYVQDHLECQSPASTDKIITLLQNQEFDELLSTLQHCSWKGSASWEDGMLEGVQAVVGEVGETIDGYHVCNNDAKLQAELWNAFVDTGVVQACNNTTATCKKPLFFYTP